MFLFLRKKPPILFFFFSFSKLTSKETCFRGTASQKETRQPQKETQRPGRSKDSREELIYLEDTKIRANERIC